MFIEVTHFVAQRAQSIGGRVAVEAAARATQGLHLVRFALHGFVLPCSALGFGLLRRGLQFKSIAQLREGWQSEAALVTRTHSAR